MNLYCLDANCFIEAWNKYYSPDFCEDYWSILSKLSLEGNIIIPYMVQQEIEKVDDNLKSWLTKEKIAISQIDEDIEKCLKEIYSKDEKHSQLVDNKKGRSLADPWVIAHAMAKKATVVTKEEKITDPATKRIKIPNVCYNMGIKCINDYDFIKELNINFNCKIIPAGN